MENLDKTLAFLLLRIWIGLRTLIAGIEKFAGYKITEEPLLDEFGDPDLSGAMVEVKSKAYGLEHYHAIPDALLEKFQEEPLLPSFLLTPYCATLGYLLIIFGITTLLGIGIRISLFVTGLIYTSLTLGLILINQSGGVAWLAIHILMVAVALTLSQYNRLSVLKKF